MSTLFGQRLEPEFDIEKEKRSGRVGWAIFGGLAVAALYEVFGGRFGVEAFQGLTATILCYGANFYVPYRKELLKWWLWKAVLMTVPLHVAYLAGLFWTDGAFPSLMTKAAIFIPVIALAFVFESLIIDQIVSYFRRIPS